MNKDIHKKLIHYLNQAIVPLSHRKDYSSLIDKIGDARFVLLGEATHGTQEFYQARLDITRQLIEKKGFMGVAIEGDWPDANRIHRYILDLSQDDNSLDALNDFKRFPTWMWRNTIMPPFLDWLKSYNNQCTALQETIGFYGLDLYSLHSSMEAVISYLEKVDQIEACSAKERYACFDHLGTEPQTYGYLTHTGMKKACVKQAVNQLLALQHHAKDYLKKDGFAANEDYFSATQNARLVKNAEAYYRLMFEGQVSSWNIRDSHMADTIDIVANHLEERFKRPSKMVIWAHNSHVGDARATEMGERGEWNIGQLIRERHDSNVYSVGFSTFEGTVAAAKDWGSPVECQSIVPALKGSYEALFHDLKHQDFILHLAGHENLEHYLNMPRLQRAIGVIYRPETERMSHYFFTKLPYQFDSIIHFDTTKALTPMDVDADWSGSL